MVVIVLGEGGALEEGGVGGSSARGFNEAGGNDAGIVAAFEGVGFFAGAGVAVKVFLCSWLNSWLDMLLYDN